MYKLCEIQKLIEQVLVTTYVYELPLYMLLLYIRLSRIMGSKLTDNNPAIADLSDQNRPTKIAERFKVSLSLLILTDFGTLVANIKFYLANIKCTYSDCMVLTAIELLKYKHKNVCIKESDVEIKMPVLFVSNAISNK